MSANRDTINDCVIEIGQLLFVIWIWFYVISKICNIFIWPYYEVCITFDRDEVNVYEICFLGSYWLILGILVHRAYALIKYEMIMLYV